MEISEYTDIAVYSLNYDLIWSEINQRDFSQRKIARAIGMTATGFKTMMDRQTMTVKNLESICTFLAINPKSLFTDSEKPSKVNEPEIEYSQSHKNRALIIVTQINELTEELQNIIDKKL